VTSRRLKAWLSFQSLIVLFGKGSAELRRTKPKCSSLLSQIRRGTRVTSNSRSLQGDFAFEHDPLVTVAGGLKAVLVVSLIVREQTENPKIACEHSAAAAALRWFDEPHGLSHAVSM